MYCNTYWSILLAAPVLQSGLKRFGVDTNNTSYKPGGGNVQVFSQKLTTKEVKPRTDTTRPKSAATPRTPKGSMGQFSYQTKKITWWHAKQFPKIMVH